MAVTVEQITELETFFEETELPATLLLESGVMVTDVKKFIATHIAVLKQNGDKMIYQVFYNRLLKAKQIIQR